MDDPLVRLDAPGRQEPAPLSNAQRIAHCLAFKAQEVLGVDLFRHQPIGSELLQGFFPSDDIPLHLIHDSFSIELCPCWLAWVLSPGEAAVVLVAILVHRVTPGSCIKAVTHAADIPIKGVPAEDQGALDAAAVEEGSHHLEGGIPTMQLGVRLEEQRLVVPHNSSQRHLESFGHVEAFNMALLRIAEVVGHVLQEVLLVASALAHGVQVDPMSSQ
mmetsp:Transcript_67924/g.147957  ORF Transcript_67924/g.147957 Transcript_67924/m.147957 type:complete len:216 (+) Transcript_67924:372-1019(+)